MHAGTPVARATFALLALMLSVYAATMGGSFATDLASYEVTKNLVEHGSVAMSYNVLATEAERGVNGRYYAPVGIGHPVYGVPFYFAARTVRNTLHFRLGKPESITKAAVVAGSAVAAALAVTLAFRFALDLCGAPGPAAAVALALGFTTILWPYSKFGFNAPLATLAALAGMYGVWFGARRVCLSRVALGAACLGYAALTRHELFVLGLPAVVWLGLESHGARSRVRSLLAFGLPFAAALIVWLLYNYLRFGNPLDTGLLRDPNVGFDTPLLVGLHGLLLSPGRSLFLYNPVVLCGVVAWAWLLRRDRNTAWLFGGTVLSLLLVIAKMHQWDGGESYGPRYLVPALPFLLLPIAPWLAARRARVARQRLRVVFCTLAVIGILVQLPGVFVDFSKAQHDYARRRTDYSIGLTRYLIDASPLVLNTRMALDAIPKNGRFLLGLATPPEFRKDGTEEQRDFSQQFAFSLDFFWLYLFYLGAIPAWVAMSLAASLVVGAVCAAWALRVAIYSEGDETFADAAG